MEINENESEHIRHFLYPCSANTLFRIYIDTFPQHSLEILATSKTLLLSARLRTQGRRGYIPYRCNMNLVFTSLRARTAMLRVRGLCEVYIRWDASRVLTETCERGGGHARLLVGRDRMPLQ